MSYREDGDPQENSLAGIFADELCDAALRLLLQEQSFHITFEDGDTIHIKFPATRRLAEFTGIPHYLILRSCAGMEQDKLLVKAERAGTITTSTGSRKLIGLLKDRYLRETEEILGAEIFTELVRKSGCA